MADGVQGSDLSEALRNSDDPGGPDSTADNSQPANPPANDGEPDTDLPEKFFDEDGNLKPKDQLAKMNANAQRKITEQSEQIQQLRDQMNQLQGQMQAVQQPEQSDEQDEPRSDEEIKEEAQKRAAERLDLDEHEDFIDLNPQEFMQVQFEEMQKLLDQREEKIQSQINQQQSNQLDRRAKKVTDRIHEEFEIGDDLEKEAVRVLQENPKMIDRMHKAPTVDEAREPVKEALILARNRRGETPTLQDLKKGTSEEDSTDSNDSQSDTGSTSVTQGVSNGNNRTPGQGDEERLEELVGKSVSIPSKRLGRRSVNPDE